MRATDIVGWVCGGAIYCNDHRPDRPEGDDEIRPVFASDEGWMLMVCDCPHNEPGEPIRFETLGEIIGIDPQGRPAQIYDDEGNILAQIDEPMPIDDYADDEDE